MTEQRANMLWGARSIAAFLGKTESAVYHLLEQRQVPGATKIGNQWVLAVDVFKRRIEEAAS